MIASDEQRLNMDKRPCKEKELRIGTWNVLTLYKGAALNNLEEQLKQYNTDIIALQEIRWTGQGIIERKNCSLYYSCHKSKHEFGCGFIVNKKMKYEVMDFKSINHRICTLRIRGRFNNISLVSAHAPTEEKSEDIKDRFYGELEKVVSKYPNNYIKILLGDFNAKVGYEDQDNSVVGKYGIHKESNNNGIRLIGLASALNMVIGSTTFPHKQIHLATWRSPDDRTTNQIDHVLIDARHKTSMMDVRSYRGANVDSDHYLVITRIRAKINKHKYNLNKEKNDRFNIERLKQIETKKEYEEQIKTLSREIEIKANIEEEWTNLEKIIKQTVQEKIGNIGKMKRNGWFDEECKQITDEKNKKYKAMINKKFTRAAKAEYQSTRREEKRIHKKKKREFYEKELAWIQECDDRNESRKFYKQVNKMREGFQVKTLSCRNKKGNIIRNDEVLKRWKEHFQEMYGNMDNRIEIHTERLQLTQEYEEILAPTVEEVEESINKLKNNKSTGPDGLNAELFKIEEPEYINRLWKLMERIWEEETFPEKWEEGLICPIFKKGDRL